LVFTSRDAVLAFLQATLQPALPNTPPDFSRTHVLLLGLRGSGKTTLAQQVYPDEAAYFDCEAPEVQRNLRSPQKFLAEVKKRLLVFDEIGQLQDPRGVLNAAVSLADRKEILSVSSRPTVPPKEGGTVYVQNWTEHRVHLLPLTWEEKSLLAREHDFARPLEEALLRPGLPGLSASSEASLETYRHWAQRVFELDLKGACPCDAAQFLRLLEFLVGRSGTWVAPGELAAACGLEGSTARECLEALHAVGMVWCVPRLEEEPPAGWRVYVADPGYVQGLRGPGLAEEARGNHLENLWKHLVLLQLRYSVKQPDNIRCWHSPKRGAVDFVVEVSPGEWAAIQCDWAGRRRLEGIRAFREIYPRGPNLRVLPRVGPLLFAESDSIDPVATPCTTGQVAGFLGEAVNLGERYRTTVLAVAGKSDSGGSGQEE
jgi:predicted AAA+ superfamily ATPase